MAARSKKTSMVSSIAPAAARVGHAAFRNIGQAVFGIVLALAILYAMDRRPPLTIGEPTVDHVVVTPGSELDVTWPQEWHRACRGEVARQIVTEHGAITQFKHFMVDPPEKLDGGDILVTSRMYVPRTEPTGNATLNSTISFSCNPLQDYWPIVVKAPSIKIKVVPSKASGSSE